MNILPSRPISYPLRLRRKPPVTPQVNHSVYKKMILHLQRLTLLTFLPLQHICQIKNWLREWVQLVLTRCNIILEGFTINESLNNFLITRIEGFESIWDWSSKMRILFKALGASWKLRALLLYLKDKLQEVLYFDVSPMQTR